MVDGIKTKFYRFQNWGCYTTLVLVCFAFVFPISGTSQEKKETQDRIQKPNIIFILVDDLGYHDLGYTGSTFYETPNVDRLAKQGMVFNNAYAASSICSPSRAAIMSGKHPARLHLTDYIPGNRHHGPHADQQLTSEPFKLQLELEEFTMAEAFNEAGYKTMFAGKWHLGEEDKFYPQYQGFDINIAGNKTGHPSGGYFSPYKNAQIADGYDGEYLTDRLTSEVIDFVGKNKEKPFFAFLSFYTVHLPLHAKPEKVAKYQKKLEQMTFEKTEFEKHGKTFYKNYQSIPQYAAMVESMDENVGRLLKALEENKVDKNTIVVFTSDNGGMATSNRTDNIPTSNLPLRAGKGYLYEGGIKEPLIIKWPAEIKPNSISEVPVVGTDFYPTLLDLAGLKLHPTQHQDGISLKEIILEDKQNERPIYWHYPHYSGGLGGRPSGAIRLGDYKLIEFYEDMHVELYHLKTDVGEQEDLSKKLPNKTKDLLDRLHAWRKEVNAQMPIKNPHYKK